MKKRNKVEEVQIENKVNSNRELTQEQKKDLDNMMNMIDSEVNKTKLTIDKFKSIKKNDAYIKRLVQAFIVILITVGIIFCINYYKEIKEFNKEYTNSVCDETQTKVIINMNNESKQLECEVVSASVLGSNGKYTEINNFEWLKSDIDTNYDKYNIEGKECSIDKNTSLTSLILNDNCLYIEYANKNKNANKEIMLCSATPVDVDLSNIEKKTLRFFEKSNPIMIKSYVNSFNDSFLMVNESIGGGELSVSTLEKVINNIESDIKTSNNNSGFILEFNGIGSLDLRKLSCFNSSHQVIYKQSDNIFRIYDREMKKDCLYVYSIYDNLGLEPGDLLKTNIENVYIHKQFDKEDSNGFCTFAILSESSIYCFKATSKDIVFEVLNQFGIDSNQLTIDKIQSVVKTNTY